MLKFIFSFILGCLSLTNLQAAICVVAAENVYGQLAQELGGSFVQVTSLLNNPNQDPHLFSASPDMSRAIASAQIVVYNGADYDNWIVPLLKTLQKNTTIVIHVSQLLNIPAGANPHLWYNPILMEQTAQTLSEKLILLDPKHTQQYQQKFRQFQKTNHALLDRIAQLKQKTQNLPVTATEPVFGYLSDLLGFKMEGLEVQWQIMNDVTPSLLQLKAYEDRLTQKKVALLFYNQQVTEPLTEKLKSLAMEHDIPVIGVFEMQPVAFKTYSAWMNATLNEVAKALKL